MKPARLTLNLSFLFLILTGCFEKTTINPEEAYKYWAGQSPDKNSKVINGSYWQSSHWSREYVVYLEIQTTGSWRREFFKQNKLVECTDARYPDDAPFWFRPSMKYRVWKSVEFDQGSRYFEDSASNHIFMKPSYEFS
jgi:hypothetical protein